MKLDVESLLNTRWAGVIHAVLIILSFGLPWVYPEDYGNTVSVYGIALTAGSELSTFGDVMGFLIAAAIMTAAAFYLMKRWNGNVAVKTSVTMFGMVALYPILAAGAIEKIRLGYVAAAPCFGGDHRSARGVKPADIGEPAAPEGVDEDDIFNRDCDVKNRRRPHLRAGELARPRNRGRRHERLVTLRFHRMMNPAMKQLAEERIPAGNRSRPAGPPAQPAAGQTVRRRGRPMFRATLRPAHRRGPSYAREAHRIAGAR